jgi:hypothetical protein
VFATRAELQSVLLKYFRSPSSGSKQHNKLIPVFFSSDAGTTISEVSMKVVGQGNQTNQSCNEEAQKAFAELQSVPLPPVESPGFHEI